MFDTILYGRSDQRILFASEFCAYNTHWLKPYLHIYIAISFFCSLFEMQLLQDLYKIGLRVREKIRKN